MNLRRRLGLASVFFALIFCFSSRKSLADVAYTFNYSVEDTGQTNVTVNGSLYNPSPDVYVSEYSLTLGLSNVDNITASDRLGKLTPDVHKKEGQTIIDLKFNDKVVGVNKPLVFTIQFTSNSIAQKNGLIWEVTLPKPSETASLKGYDVSLSVPLSFGPVIYSSPPPNIEQKTLTKRNFKFNRETLGKTGAILSFGPYQLYSFDLKYNLKNSNLFEGKAQVALPPSIFGEQEVVFDRISPTPITVTEDADGNYVAEFRVASGKTLTVEVIGKVKILNPKRDLSESGPVSEVPLSLLQSYTSAQKYWEVESPEIKQLVKSAVGAVLPNDNAALVAQKLFYYVASYLSYDANRINPSLIRFGALKALQNPKEAVCMEFADLLTSALREAGLPAEVLEGFAYTKDSINRPVVGDVLHSWVRVYLPRIGWVAVDPTWTNTTGGLNYFSQFDTNHFIFAINGHNSETPYPAGAYKISPDQTGDINVKVLDGVSDLKEEGPKIKVSAAESLPRSFLFFHNPGELILTFINQGSQTAFSSTAKLDSGYVDQPSLNLGDLPPFGSITQKFDTRDKKISPGEIGSLSFLDFDGKVYRLPIELSYGTAKPKTETFIYIFSALAPFGFAGLLLVVRRFLRR
ncbi:MAG: transglutaminase domain-containing protein [Patescibacteria group bacterium]|nr:transglutaminase domain-containing protein [Patescibacteria group bacterium]